MTPFDWASLSLNGSELPPPTVGGSPLTSGGQVAPLSGRGVAVDCASDTFAVTTVTNAAMIGMTERKATPSRFAERVGQRADPLKRSHGIGTKERRPVRTVGTEKNSRSTIKRRLPQIGPRRLSRGDARGPARSTCPGAFQVPSHPHHVVAIQCARSQGFCLLRELWPAAQKTIGNQ
jgi:hypothetical protein